jgi:tRNA nucleotidyltransferase (CCA-adding enzyme)
MVLEQAARLSDDPIVRFAALTHDLGKGITPKEHWPKHYGHEAASVKLLDALCARLRIPNDYRECAAAVARYHGHAHRAQELRPATVLELLENLDALRRPTRFEQFLLACEADIRGRTGFEDREYPQANYLRRALTIASEVKADPTIVAKLSGPKIGEYLRGARIAALKAELVGDKA